MQGPIITTTTAGRLRGVRARGVDSFLGVPYGAPTGGQARFRAPRPAESWSGVRDAVAFGPAAPQVDPRHDAGGDWAELLELLYPRGGTPVEAGPMSEDSLVLNVWAPSTRPADGLPVMVWFHGGGFASGTGAEGMFHGANLARMGRAVIVTVNHRLGILGYTPLAHLLGAECASSGSAGIADLVLALEWVHDNITGFGGDPARVTIFGQSGGGAKVATLFGVPAARGLFAQAIIQSGVLGMLRSAEAGQTYTSALLDVFGIPESRADLLLELPLDHLIEGQRRFPNPIQNFVPTLDGTFLPEHPYTDTVSPLAHDVPLLIGSTTHEMAMMQVADPGYAGLTHDDLPQRLAGHYPERADQILRDYRERHPEESAPLLLSRIVTDRTFGLDAARGADAKSLQPAPVYRYEFAYETTALRGVLGSCHSLDLPFVFGNVASSPFAGDRPDRHEVSRAMACGWLSFAETGVPTTPCGDAWPQYSTANGRLRTVIDAEWSVRESPDPAEFGVPIGSSWLSGPEDGAELA